MQAGKTQFHVGDWIVHAFYGIGKIIDQEKMKLSGKAQTFFAVKLNDGKYWLSKEKTKADHIRPLASEKEISDALQEMKKAPRALSKQYRSKKKEILNTIETGSLIQQAGLIRDLHARKMAKIISFENRNWLARLKKQFIREWSLVSGRKTNALKKELKGVLKSSKKRARSKN